MQTISVYRNGTSQKSQEYSDGEMLVMQAAANAYAVVIGATGEIITETDKLGLAKMWARLASKDLPRTLERIAIFNEIETEFVSGDGWTLPLV